MGGSSLPLAGSQVLSEELKMLAYVTTKIIRAVPMDEVAFLAKSSKRPFPVDSNRPGYVVAYSDDYESWLPKDTFEAVYGLASP